MSRGAAPAGAQDGRCHLLPAAELLPEAWRAFRDAGPVRAFNPGLLRHGEGWLFACRLVGVDGLRRIALCRLDAGLGVLAGSPTAFSDAVRFDPGSGYSARATSWFADPRLYRLAGRLYLYWNSGWHEPRNHQFLQLVDPESLAPVGLARELLVDGERQPLEKNWTFFDEEGPRGVYSVHPHVGLRLRLDGEGPVRCERLPAHAWDASGYSERYGPLRGGAPPQRLGGHYYSFCHSVYGPVGRYRYAPAVYRFSAEAPHAPTDLPAQPLPLPNPFGASTLHERLNPVVEEAVYPCGAAHDGAGWLVSYGINDESCAIARLDERVVAACMRPAPR